MHSLAIRGIDCCIDHFVFCLILLTESLALTMKIEAAGVSQANELQFSEQQIKDFMAVPHKYQIPQAIPITEPTETQSCKPSSKTFNASYLSIFS